MKVPDPHRTGVVSIHAPGGTRCRRMGDVWTTRLETRLRIGDLSPGIGPSTRDPSIDILVLRDPTDRDPDALAGRVELKGWGASGFPDTKPGGGTV